MKQDIIVKMEKLRDKLVYMALGIDKLGDYTINIEIVKGNPIAGICRYFAEEVGEIIEFIKKDG